MEPVTGMLSLDLAAGADVTRFAVQSAVENRKSKQKKK